MWLKSKSDKLLLLATRKERLLLDKADLFPISYIVLFYVTVFLSLVSMSCGFNNMVLVFEGGDAGQHCVTPGNVTSDGGDNSSYTHYYPGEQTLCA